MKQSYVKTARQILDAIISKSCKGIALTRNWGVDDHWVMQSNRTAVLKVVMRNCSLVSFLRVGECLLCVHMCGFRLCLSHNHWPDFERLKHCEDDKELNGVVAYQLYVFRKFSS